MNEKPILFKDEMVRAILSGQKTQTRRKCCDLKPCNFGEIGDKLWVKETFAPIYAQQASYNGGNPIEYDYRATYKLGYRLGDKLFKKIWKPSIFMPRIASRILLEITSVKKERLGEISIEDVHKEGFTSKAEFKRVWTQINGCFEADLLVWVIEFRRVK